MGDKFRPIAKNILTGVIILAAAVLAGFVLITGVYLIPTGSIREHVKQSSSIIDEEGLMTYYLPWLGTTRRDNYTDCIMMSMAAYNGTGSLVYRAMTSNYVYVTEEQYYYEPGYLLRMLGPTDDGVSVEVSYSRYWHGYLVLLKPLLLVFDYGAIRIVNGVFQIIMLGLIMLEMVHDKKAKKMILPLLLVIFAINPVSAAMNMQFACIYNITLVSLYVLFKTHLFEKEHYWKMFMIIGIAAAFFDFLTYPLACLGIPLIMMLVRWDEKSSESIKATVFSCISWGIGYAFMWASKWILCDILTGSSTIADALNQVKERTVTDAYEVTGIRSDNILDVFGYNVEAFRDWLSFSVFAAAVVGIVLFAVIAKRKFKVNENTLIALLLIAMIPFVWYAVLSNHSAIHSFMTYRNLTLTIMAVAGILVSSISPKQAD